MHEPTEEQLAILQAAEETEDNILISALAGAAKTTSLEMLAHKLRDVNILALAFNKRIQLETQERMPPNVKAMTLNGLGHRTWMEATGRRLRLDPDKTYNLMKELMGEFTGKDREVLWENFAELKRLIAFGKQCGYVPTGHFDRAKRLMDCDEFFQHLENILSPVEEEFIRMVTVDGLKAAFQGDIDFDDQIFMPTIFHGAFPRYPLVLVDEAQDLSALNHAILRKLAKKRLIAVGDSRQAIYGFRGAHENSMALLKHEFNMRELTLSLTFRCKRAIVEHARWRAPHFRWHNDGGEVRTLACWSAKDLPEHAFILCRNNAPLFNIALKLLRSGRHVEVANSDVAKGLLKIMLKFGDKNMLQPDVLASIDAWEAKEKEKTKERGHGNIEDRANCMRLFAQQGTYLSDAVAYVQHLINSTGTLKLMTGHKSKGLETDHVFILDSFLIRNTEQDPNLRYVMQTRARETLTYITTEGYEA